MRRSVPKRALAIVAVVALGTSGLVLAASTDVVFVSEAPASVRVPNGRVGDIVDYRVVRDIGDTLVGTYHYRSVTQQFAERWEVGGVGPLRDQTWTERSGVEVNRTVQFLGLRPSTLYPGPGAWGYAFDLQARGLLRADHGASEYGPDFGHSRPDWGGASLYWDPVWSIFLLQGTPLAIGDDLSGVLGPARSAHLRSNERPLEHRLVVDRSGLMDGQALLGVTLREHRFEPIRTTNVQNFESWTNETWWFSSTSPYPVRVHGEYHTVHPPIWLPQRERVERRFNETRYLIEYKAGGDELQWGWPLPATRPTTDSAWTPRPGPHPGTGEGWNGVFPLEEARRSLENDPSATAFVEWRLSNPDARLVGFEYNPAVPRTADGESWFLFYAAPFRQSLFQAFSVRLATGVVVNSGPEGREIFLATNERFDPKTLPAEFITLGQADAIWRSVAGTTGTSTDRRWANWGYAMVHGSTWDPDHPFAILNFASFACPSECRPTERTLGGRVEVAAATGNVSAAALRYTAPVMPLALPSGPTSSAPPIEPTSVAAASIIAAPNTVLWTVSISLLALIALLGWRLLDGLGFGLYSKLPRREVLEHPLRDQIVGLVHINPGISAPALQKETGAGWSTVTYHLYVLHRHEILKSVRDGRHRRYFVAGTVPADRRSQLAVLQNPGTRRAFELVSAKPGIGRRVVADCAKWTPAGALWHLRRLEQAGLVRRETRGRSVGYVARVDEVGGEASAALVTHGA
ncbi:MAG: hypothetical protein HYT80_05200 [Euryarchaeota archaeon]|nr:hypothetical protein [Euryarchaeota archaeon]